MTVRVRRFVAAMKMSRQAAYDNLLAEKVDQELTRMLSGHQIGPRGGVYRPFGEIEFLGPAEADDDIIRNEVTRAARRNAYYVRPPRKDRPRPGTRDLRSALIIIDAINGCHGCLDHLVTLPGAALEVKRLRAVVAR